MDRETVDKAKEIIKLIDENKNSLSELENCLRENSNIYVGRMEYDCVNGMTFPKSIFIEDWEIRLMIHNKRQRIAALEKQLEQL